MPTPPGPHASRPSAGTPAWQPLGAPGAPGSPAPVGPTPDLPGRSVPPRRGRPSGGRGRGAVLVGLLGLLLVALVGLSVRAWLRARPDADAAPRAPSTPSLAIVTAEVEGLPDLPPVLVGDTLVVRVTYAGGCETHELGLDRETRGDTLVLSLEHDARGDDCTDPVYEELRLPVGDAPAGPVVLVDPETGARLPVGRARP